eukprot:scaffold298895_cov31-Tisochrysis_lutea.AAC.3
MAANEPAGIGTPAETAAVRACAGVKDALAPSVALAGAALLASSASCIAVIVLSDSPDIELSAFPKLRLAGRMLTFSREPSTSTRYRSE